jgi:Domain of unknown function (DUF5615)
VRFLADMGVSPPVVAWLNEQGHDAVHLSDRGLERAADAEIFKLAAAERERASSSAGREGQSAGRHGRCLLVLSRLVFVAGLSHHVCYLWVINVGLVDGRRDPSGLLVGTINATRIGRQIQLPPRQQFGNR